MKPARPVCRYPGSKWRLAPWIIDHFPPHKCYLEAFGGSGAVLMQKKPSRVEVWNDLNDEMVNLFRVLRDTIMSQKLISLLRLTPWSRSEWLACHEFCDDVVEQARRTVVLMSQSHGTAHAINRRSNGWRSSTSGWHRLPQDFHNYVDNLSAISHRLLNVMIENRDAKYLCQQHDWDTSLHYLDPPYLGETRRRNDRSLYTHEMRSESDHVEFSEWTSSLAGYVLISGYDSELYNDLFLLNGWGKKSKVARTGAAKKGDSLSTEVIYINPRLQNFLNRKTLFSV